nr:MAG TPA: hypothetical protein [Caudoviricetes sp.]
MDVTGRPPPPHRPTAAGGCPSAVRVAGTAPPPRLRGFPEAQVSEYLI